MDSSFKTKDLHNVGRGVRVFPPIRKGGWGRKVEEGDMGASSGASGHLEAARSPCELWALGQQQGRGKAALSH